MFAKLEKRIKGLNKRLLFSEGEDLRVLTAASRAAVNKTFKAVVLGRSGIIKGVALKNDLDISDVEIIDIENNSYYGDALKLMIELRKGKQDEETCRKLLKQANYLGTMLVKMKVVSGLVGGATYSTADTVRPALQLIKAKKGYNIVSSSFILIPVDKSKRTLVYGDCGVVTNPSSAELVEITKASVETARSVELDPKVALLSFSTLGSAVSVETKKTIEVVELLKQANVDFDFVGEIQFDAAYDNNVAKTKAKGSLVAGNCNVFIFPNLEAGNIAYKITQYLGNYQAIGPILQGLAAPINDLSRGADSDEIYNMAVLTVAQSLNYE